MIYAAACAAVPNRIALCLALPHAAVPSAGADGPASRASYNDALYDLVHVAYAPACCACDDAAAGLAVMMRRALLYSSACCACAAEPGRYVALLCAAVCCAGAAALDGIARYVA